MSHYTVGELANHLGVTVRTLQYYDRKGLLTVNVHQNQIVDITMMLIYNNYS